MQTCVCDVCVRVCVCVCGVCVVDFFGCQSKKRKT